MFWWSVLGFVLIGSGILWDELNRRWNQHLRFYYQSGIPRKNRHPQKELDQG